MGLTFGCIKRGYVILPPRVEIVPEHTQDSEQLMGCTIVFIVVVAALVLIILWWIGVYNKLIRLRNGCDRSWAQIDVQLKRRYDLIPNLVETVKGYAKHERETLQNVIRARQGALDAGNVGDQAQAEGFLTQALGKLFALAEAYPDLKANQNFLDLQDELSTLEQAIAQQRQIYNDAAVVYNNACQVFPNSLVASMSSFEPREYYEVHDPEVREAPKVSF
jgi:LemA protein